MPQFVVCIEAIGSPSVAPCVDAGGKTFAPVMMEMAAPGAISLDNADLLFAYGFGPVLGMFAIGVAIGSILSLIRKGE